jgi:hypothetical protein
LLPPSVPERVSLLRAFLASVRYLLLVPRSVVTQLLAFFQLGYGRYLSSEHPQTLFLLQRLIFIPCLSLSC